MFFLNSLKQFIHVYLEIEKSALGIDRMLIQEQSDAVNVYSK